MKYQVAILTAFFAAAAIISNLYIFKILIAAKLAEQELELKLSFMGQDGIIKINKDLII